MSCTLHTLANEKLIELEKNKKNGKNGIASRNCFSDNCFFKFISILFGVLNFDVREFGE